MVAVGAGEMSGGGEALSRGVIYGRQFLRGPKNKHVCAGARCMHRNTVSPGALCLVNNPFTFHDLSIFIGFLSRFSYQQ